MRQFLKYVLATVVGVFLAGFLLFILINGIIIKQFNKAVDDGAAKVVPNSVLRLNLNYPIPDQTPQDLFSNMDWLTFSTSYRLGMNDILKSIDHAATDDRIKGIMLDMGLSSNGMATLEEIRNALLQFRAESGKFIIGYGQMASQGSYYLASTADEIYLSPGGIIDLKGFNADITFYTKTLEKVGIEAQVFYDGRFKSATEPFRLTEMSEANREQIRGFMGGMFNHYMDNIAEGRGNTSAHFKQVADSLYAYFPELALEKDVIDGLKYDDEVEDILRGKLGIDMDDKIHYVTLNSYVNTLNKGSNAFNTGNLAVVYAEGDIVDGAGSFDNIGASRMVKLLRKVKQDESIKSVVLRVNSPGGSAFASDLIWREVIDLKKEKPVVVSMGNYAASGGYFISCAASKILAQPNTLTGSIGVFLILPNAGELMKDKIGLNFDNEMTSAHADFPSIDRPVTEWERRFLQASVDSTYVDFKRKVAEGRESMNMEMVEEVAQGRVWTGTQALENGLVDEIGGLDRAIELAASLAGLEEHTVREFPEADSKFIRELIYGLADQRDVRFMKTELGEYYKYVETLIELKKYKGMQARMPYTLTIN